VTLAVLAGVFLFLLFLRVPVAFCIGISSLAAMLCSLPPDPAAMTIAQRVGMSVTSFPASRASPCSRSPSSSSPGASSRPGAWLTVSWTSPG